MQQLQRALATLRVLNCSKLLCYYLHVPSDIWWLVVSNIVYLIVYDRDLSPLVDYMDTEIKYARKRLESIV